MNKPVNDPWWAVMPPEEGESWWQPLPSRGHVTLKLTNENSPYDTFTTGIQVLPPGCYVREHGHRGNHELIFIHEGSGEVQIEGNTYPLEKGATVMFGRYARHIITNTGDVDLDNIDVTDDIRARGAADNRGDTSLGIFFERDY